MNKQTFGTLGTAKLSMKLMLSVAIVMLASACDFIDKGSSTNIPSDNPGKNANLADAPRSPGDNSHRIHEARKETLSCTITREDVNGVFTISTSCATPKDDGLIKYCYTGYLDTPTEAECDADVYPGDYLYSATEYVTNDGSDVAAFRRYYYDASNPNRLDKVAVRGQTGNFNTLHDYTYDDEDDPSDFLADVDDALDNNTTNDADGYNANTTITDPKLRLEYICDIDAVDDIAAGAETCDRDNAREVIRYIYYADGRLYRKEFDVQNNTEIDHQKIYYYQDGLLTRVDTDNFYNGIIDERYTYERNFFESEETMSLRVFIDNGFLAAGTRGTDRTVSYLIDEQNTVERECYFRGEFQGLQGGENIGDNINGTCIEGDEHSFSWEPSWKGNSRTVQIFHWDFTWDERACWAGGLDDIDPEARAIDFLCKESEV